MSMSTISLSKCFPNLEEVAFSKCWLFFVLIYDMRTKRIRKFFWYLPHTVSTYPWSLLWLNIHAYRNKQDAETGSCFSSRNNRSSPICHLFTPGWMWVEMLEVKSGDCQCLFSIQKRNPPFLLSSVEEGQCYWRSLSSFLDGTF